MLYGLGVNLIETWELFRVAWQLTEVESAFDYIISQFVYVTKFE